MEPPSGIIHTMDTPTKIKPPSILRAALRQHGVELTASSIAGLFTALTATACIATSHDDPPPVDTHTSNFNAVYEQIISGKMPPTRTVHDLNDILLVDVR